jgi:hypothetical protein
MDESSPKRWQTAAMILGVVYLVVGITFAALAGSVSSSQMRVTWRLVAWSISGAAFAAHLWYEQFRLRHSPATTALHVSLAVGLGASGLAAAANIRALMSGSSHHNVMLLLSLVLWPALTAVPAFAVALGAASLLAFRRRGA